MKELSLIVGLLLMLAAVIQGSMTALARRNVNLAKENVKQRQFAVVRRDAHGVMPELRTANVWSCTVLAGADEDGNVLTLAHFDSPFCMAAFRRFEAALEDVAGPGRSINILMMGGTWLTAPWSLVTRYRLAKAMSKSRDLRFVLDVRPMSLMRPQDVSVMVDSQGYLMISKALLHVQGSSAPRLFSRFTEVDIKSDS